MSEQAGRYQRSFSGMVGAMLVLLVVVGAFVAVRDLNRDDPADPARPVEWRTSAAFARDDAGYDVLSPDRLPEGWIVTSVRYRAGEEGSWHLGMLTDDRRYVGIEQAAGAAEALVAQFVDDDATRAADVTVAGTTWQRWDDDGGDEALVREEDAVTSLVVGQIPADELAGFVAELRRSR